MANFTIDQINDAWGFFGELRGSTYGLSREEALAIYNLAVDILGGNPENARQFLDAQTGRHFADALTWVIQKPFTFRSVKDALLRSKDHKQTSSFFKRYAKFQPYETAKDVVEQLLGEETPSQTFKDFSSWKTNAEHRGLTVRTGTHPDDGSVNSYSTAKDREGNERGHFDHKVKTGVLFQP